MNIPWTKPYYKKLTLAALASRIGNDFHERHDATMRQGVVRGFGNCIHEICEDSRELIHQLEALEAAEESAAT